METTTVVVAVIGVATVLSIVGAVRFIWRQFRSLFRWIMKPSAKSKAKAKEESDQMVAEVTRLLEIGEHQRAAEFRALHYSKTGTGIGIDWKRYNYGQQDEPWMGIIFGQPPIPLKTLNKDILQRVRVAGALAYLIDHRHAKRYLKGVTSGIDRSSYECAMFLFTRALHNRQIFGTGNEMVKGLKFEVAEQNPCPVCSRLNGKVFPLKSAPDLPYDHCQKTTPCCILPFKIFTWE